MPWRKDSETIPDEADSESDDAGEEQSDEAADTGDASLEDNTEDDK